MSSFLELGEVLRNLPSYVRTLMSREDDDEEGYESPTEDLNVDEIRRDMHKALIKKIMANREVSFRDTTSLLLTPFSKSKRKSIDKFMFNTLNVHCGHCESKIQFDSKFYRCFECKNTGVCRKCATAAELDGEEVFHRHDNIDYFRLVSKSRGESYTKIENEKTCVGKVLRAFEEFGDAYLVGFYDLNNRVKWIKYKEVHQDTLNLATAMNLFGAQQGDFIGICAGVVYPYILADLTCIYSGFVSVPIQRIMSLENKKYIAEKCELKFVVVNKKYLQEFIEIKKTVKSITKIILIDELEEDKGLKNEELGVLLLSELLKTGNGIEKKTPPHSKPKDDDIRNIIFTSGSTSRPKGVSYTEIGWMNEFSGVYIPMGFPYVATAFAPFSHLAGRITFTKQFSNGFRMFLTEKIEKFFDNCKVVRPTLVSMVPRMLYLVYERFKLLVREEMTKTPELDELEIPKLKLEQVKKLRDSFGDRMVMLILYGAAVSVKVKKFATKYLKFPIMETYALSELGQVSSNYRSVVGDNIKLIDVPELEYFTTDRPYPRGEIYVRRKSGIEYFREEEDTKFGEKWFATGDIGEMRGKRLRIIDRRINIKKLSQGEFISYEKIENILKTSEFVNQIMVYSTQNSSFIVALIVPSFKKEESEEFVKETITKEILRIGTENKFQLYEIPKKTIIAKESFTRENEMLTMTGKMKRRVILKKYKEEFDAIFESEMNMQTLASTVLNLSNVDITKSFQELGGDSVSAILFISQLRKKGIDLSYSDLMSVPIGELMNRSKSFEGKIDRDAEMEKMKKLMSNLEKAEIRKETKNIFFTGATGYLGKFILRELLKTFNEEVNIHCLVREGSIGKITVGEKNKSRVTFVIGDLTQERLGIKDDEVYQNLKQKIDLIIHNGAYVNHFLSFQDLYPVNVRPIYDIVALACGRPLIFTSSIAAYLTAEKRTKNINEVKHDFNNGYASTKWLADVLLNNFYPNSCIFRCSLIGFSDDGDYNDPDWIIRFLKFMLSAKIFPKFANEESSEQQGRVMRAGSSLDMISVDFVAYTIAKFAKERKTGIFDLSMKNVSFSEMLQFGEEISSEQFERIPYDVIVDNMKDSPMMLPLVTMMQLNYSKYLRSERGMFEGAGFDDKFVELMRDDPMFQDEKENYKKKMKAGVKKLIDDLK